MHSALDLIWKRISLDYFENENPWFSLKMNIFGLHWKWISGRQRQRWCPILFSKCSSGKETIIEAKKYWDILEIFQIQLLKFSSGSNMLIFQIQRGKYFNSCKYFLIQIWKYFGSIEKWKYFGSINGNILDLQIMLQSKHIHIV